MSRLLLLAAAVVVLYSQPVSAQFGSGLPAGSGSTHGDFLDGRETDAFQRLYVRALTSKRGATEVLGDAKWVAGIKRPVVGLRWGIGIVTKPKNYRGNPAPLRLAPPTKEDGKENEKGIDPAAGAKRLIDIATGDLGAKFIAGYEERLRRGDYGTVLMNAPAAALLPAPVAAAPFSPFNVPVTQPAAVPAATPFGTAAPAVPKPASPFGPPSPAPAPKPAAAPFGPAGDATPFGPATPTPKTPPGSAASGPNAPTLAPATSNARGKRKKKGAESNDPESLLVMPGLTCFGVGTESALLRKARDEGIDVMVIFSLSVKPTSRNVVSNDTSIRLISVENKERLYETKKLNNIRTWGAHRAGRDEVTPLFTKLFDYMDKRLKMAPLPRGLNTANVAHRVAALSRGKYENPLPALTEMKLYHSKFLLSDGYLVKGYQGILGATAARTLASGSEAQRNEVLKKWLPES